MSDTPWHHRPIAALAILWYLISAVDYVLTKIEFGPWMSYFTPDQIAYFTSLPLWINASWAVHV